MSTFTWPSARALTPATMTWGWRLNTRTTTSALSGATQRITLPGSRFTALLQMPHQLRADRQALLAFLAKVGGDHLIALHDVANPLPRGTCATTGVTASAAVQFATALTLNGCGNATTLLAGDKLSVPLATGLAQLVMVTDDAVATAGGVMSLSIRPMLRAAVNAAAAVTLVQPTTTWRLDDPDVAALWQPNTGGPIGAPMSIALTEDFG